MPRKRNEFKLISPFNLSIIAVREFQNVFHVEKKITVYMLSYKYISNLTLQALLINFIQLPLHRIQL